MLNTILDIILHNLLVRELFIVFLIVVVMLRYISKYVGASRNPNPRIRTRRMATTLKDTRGMLIVLVIALVAVIGYDRVIRPHFASAPVETHKVAKKKTPKIVDVNSKSSSDSSTKKATKKKQESIKGAITATSGSVMVPDGDMTKAKAVAIVANYFGQHPEEKAQASAAYKCEKKGKGDASIAVYMVTGYERKDNGKLKSEHMYWVYPSGKFTTKY
ncbi:hypothetical protein [Lacticaseibacillus hulanensis]|uniref:hypothetical protein n=1 Tax=Lacticaseibacillus hulanensis TaxID=2493111 RepID=UPI000FD91A41|nr:hypothetical protein [Lacticaseibacillus hulanensis]